MSAEIIALGAHCDDIDLQAGAAFAKWGQERHSLLYGVVTTSASGVPGASPDEAYAIRHEESRAAAHVYGAEPIFFDYGQCIYPPGSTSLLPKKLSILSASVDETEISKMAAFFTLHRPEIIITHTPDDLHEDHHHVAAFVFRAWKKLRDNGGASRLLLWRPSHRGSINPYIPTLAIEVNEEDVATQDRAIRAHTSQYNRTPWFKDFAEIQAKKCGQQFGHKYAQPFVEVVY